MLWTGLSPTSTPSRALFRAKNVVRAVHSVTRRRLRQGEAVFRQGEPGLSLFTVGKGELDVVKEHAGVRRTVARLSPGTYGGAACGRRYCCSGCSTLVELLWRKRFSRREQSPTSVVRNRLLFLCLRQFCSHCSQNMFMCVWHHED